MDEPQELIVRDWTLKVRVPEGQRTHPVIFLIHGWTGDENSMWVFASRLPRTACLIAPRAPYDSKHPDGLGGYSWVPERGESFSSFDMFQPALNSFAGLIRELEKEFPGDFKQFGMVGFSQGAAFIFAYAMQNPSRVGRLASLAGFLPAESQDLSALEPIPVFMAHGMHDETVPVSMARDARDVLEQSKVKVTYCESETGHKLGSNCAKVLASFFSKS